MVPLFTVAAALQLVFVMLGHSPVHVEQAAALVTGVGADDLWSWVLVVDDPDPGRCAATCSRGERRKFDVAAAPGRGPLDHAAFAALAGHGALPWRRRMAAGEAR